MLKLTLSTIAASLLVLSPIATPAQAQPTRVFVAAQGLDSNPCTFAQPCRTFQHAHDVVAANGEIDVLDPAGYGMLTITKAISIQGHGFAGLAVPSGNGIVISAGPDDIVNLRGLLLDGIGTGNAGIVFGTGAALDIQDCLIRNFQSFGIYFGPVASSALFVSGTHISANGGNGIYLQPFGSGATAAFHRVLALRNGYGIYVLGLSSSGRIKVEIGDSVIANNSIDGVFSDSTTAPTIVTVRNSMVTNNGSQGVYATGPTATLRLIRSTVTGNAVGWATQNGGTLTSSGENNIDDNGAGNGAPPLNPPK